MPRYRVVHQGSEYVTTGTHYRHFQTELHVIFVGRRNTTTVIICSNMVKAMSIDLKMQSSCNKCVPTFACPICTFLNEITESRCTMCNFQFR